MILVEIENTIMNFSNAHVIEFCNDVITVNYNNDVIVTMHDTNEIDTSSFDNYFFCFSNEKLEVYFNKQTFLMIQEEESNLNIFFCDNFKYQLHNVDLKFFINQVT